MIELLVKKIKIVRKMRKSLKYIQYSGNHKQADLLEKSIETLKLALQKRI